MKEDFLFYLEILKSDIPFYVYECLLVVFVLVAVLIVAIKRKGAGRGIILLVFVEYLSLIYCTTVFFRSANDAGAYDVTPFWSYDRPELLVPNIMNVLVFIPIGFLLGFLARSIKWWTVLLIGVFFSVSIELLQFCFKSGFSEVDDVMHNTLGCVIGYGITQLLMIIYSSIIKQNKGVKY